MTTPENSTQTTMPPVTYARKDSTLAIISLVSGLLAWSFLPIIGAIASIITGHLAKKEIRDSGGSLGGDGMALAGLILGYVQIGLIVLGIVCLITFFVALVPAFQTGFTHYTSLVPGIM